MTPGQHARAVSPVTSAVVRCLVNEQIRPEEPTPVQLTRMEGILNLVAERVSNLGGRVDTHDREFDSVKADISGLQSLTQTLREGADADKKTAVALALALKEADETRRTKSEASWSPITKVFAVLAAVGVLVTIWYSLKP